ncbi:unnamed protein product [Rhodiola kirilowii]
MNEGKRRWVKILLNTRINLLPVKYLGFPLTTRSISSGDCATIIQRLTRRLESWNNRFLSRAGRRVLIESVLRAIILYWARICFLPKKVEGGFGIRNMNVMNDALVLNQFWDFNKEGQNLWIFGSMPTGPKDEVNWHSLAWNRFNTPRAPINAVLAAHDRLLTKSRLRVMGMMIAPICVLCNEEEENRDHLFFRCRVARGICGEVLKFLKVSAAPCHWHLLIPWFNSLGQNGVTYSMYLIWKAMNSIIFRHESLLPINLLGAAYSGGLLVDSVCALRADHGVEFKHSKAEGKCSSMAAAAGAAPIFISTSALRSTLTYQTLIDHFHKSLPNLSPDTFTSPHRQSYALSPSSSSSSLLLMPAWSSSPSLPYIGVKLVTYFPTNSSLNLPGVHGSYVLFSSSNGQTLATMDGTELTHWRTACVSALASQFLSLPRSETLLMVGAGFLAPHLISAHLTARPELKRVIIWNRTEKKARELADKFQAERMFEGVAFDSCQCLDDVVPLADIVSCATNANAPLVKGEKLKKGAHLDLVGSFAPAMMECDDEAIRRGRVFIDNEAAFVEAGELVGAFQRGVILRDDVAGSLVQVIKGERAGRRNDEEITVFKSVGSAVVDVLCAQLVYEAYLKKGIGSRWNRARLRLEARKSKDRALKAVNLTVDDLLERLEDGQIVSDAEIERGGLRGTQGPAGKGYIEKSKAFWEVKSAENRAAGAGMELKFHQNLLASTKISVSEDVLRKSALEWMFTLFAKEEDSNRILNLGPWSFDNRSLVLKPWSPDENYELESVTALPIWVRFPGLNLHMRCEEILSMIASTVGKPLRTDGFTATSEKLYYARVLIEVYASKELKREVGIKRPRSTNYYQIIHYEWVPPRCNHCQRFGHLENKCTSPRLSIDEEEEDDIGFVVEPENEKGLEEQAMERLRHKSRQTLKVPVEGSGERQRVNSNSLSHVSLVSNTPQEDGGAIVAENKEISPIVEGDSSSVLEISESIEESKDSIESEAPFIEKFDVGLLVVLEAKVKLEKCRDIVNKCCPDNNWQFFCFKENQNMKIRMILMWNPNVFKVDIWFASSQLMLWLDVEASGCSQTGLRDVAASGNFCTWSDHHEEGARIWCKLDRIIVNERMTELFPSVKGLFPDPEISDHCPAITFLGEKPNVKRWFHFQGISGRGLARNPNCEALRKEEAQELLNFKKILKYQFIFNCQRARLIGPKRGEDGDYSFDPNDIKEQYVNYFRELFNGQHSRVPVVQEELCYGSKVKEEDCVLLVSDVSYNEVAEIVKNLPSFKAVGPDGYNAEFFKAAWLYIGKYLLNSIRNILLTGDMPSGINSTNLALIPKVNNACRPSSENFQYHPKCARICMTHLLFADDVIIFSKANMGSLGKVTDALRTFHKCSGLKGRKLREADYNVIIDKMTSKIKSWGAKCLSYAGRLVLVKHVLSTNGSYNIGEQKSGSVEGSVQAKTKWRAGNTESLPLQ